MNDYTQSDALCDAAIIALADGDESALSTVYRTYGRLILSIARRMLPHPQDAEDVLQDVMLKVLKQAHNYRTGTNPRAWLAAITRSCSINHLSASSRFFPAEACTEESYDLIDPQLLFVRDALSSLPPDDRLLIHLHLHADLTHREIASVLKITEGSARKRYSRAIEKLRVLCTATHTEKGGSNETE